MPSLMGMPGQIAWLLPRAAILPGRGTNSLTHNFLDPILKHHPGEALPKLRSLRSLSERFASSAARPHLLYGS